MRNKNSTWLDEQCSAALSAAAALRQLSVGDLAELRRMPPTGAPVFWLLAARHPDTIGHGCLWVTIIRVLAILTPRGNPAQRPDLHQQKRPLGEVLCDGGDPGWSGASPVFSQARLRHLIAAPQDQRARLLERAARMIGGRMVPGGGVNVTHIAAAVLTRDPGKLLARPYYRRLDRAEARKASG